MREVYTDKAARLRNPYRYPGEQVTHAPAHDHLNEQAEATVLAVFAAVICASLSVGLVIGIGICRTLGAR